jgi:flavin reductase (DIM6/NTAB) family NADH-FMN oxidoreductase RutF
MMAGFPTGVAIVTTTKPDGRPWGMTCSSVCSVTTEPPTLLVCLRRESPTLAALLRQRSFAVNLLHESARDVAELFASGTADRFDRVRWRSDPASGGPHLVEHSHVIGDCRVSGTELVGDHIVVFGEVLRVTHQPPRRSPLLYGMRGYASWPAAPHA